MSTNNSYSNRLEDAAKEIHEKSKLSSVNIRGEGESLFLVANSGKLGVEIYDNNEMIILDRAIGRELQGEIEFRTYSDALDEALLWLNREQGALE